jgi:hypothetical protein
MGNPAIARPTNTRVTLELANANIERAVELITV